MLATKALCQILLNFHLGVEKLLIKYFMWNIYFFLISIQVIYSKNSKKLEWTYRSAKFSRQWTVIYEISLRNARITDNISEHAIQFNENVHHDYFKVVRIEFFN